MDPHYKLVGQYGSTFGTVFHYRFDQSWNLSTGLGGHYKRYMLVHEPVSFDKLNEGSLFLKTLFGALEVPLLLRYEKKLSARSGLSFSTGVVLNQFGLNRSAVGFTKLSYAGSDSLKYDIIAEGSYVRRLSADPYINIAYEHYGAEGRSFGISVYYQYTPVAAPTITYRSELSNSNSTKQFVTPINGNLSVVGISFLYYPTWLIVGREVPDDPAEPE